MELRETYYELWIEGNFAGLFRTQEEVIAVFDNDLMESGKDHLNYELFKVKIYEELVSSWS